MAIQRQRQGRAQPGVPLKVVAGDAIDLSAPSCKVGSGNRHPNTGTKTVDEVSLERINRVLLACPTAEKILVVRKEPYGCGQLRRPWLPCLGKEMILDAMFPPSSSIDRFQNYSKTGEALYH